jgi:hypothetical protein
MALSPAVAGRAYARRRVMGALGTHPATARRRVGVASVKGRKWRLEALDQTHRLKGPTSQIMSPRG